MMLEFDLDQFVIDHRGLSALLLLLLHDNEHLRRDACRATSNITAGNADQIQVGITTKGGFRRGKKKQKVLLKMMTAVLAAAAAAASAATSFFGQKTDERTSNQN